MEESLSAPWQCRHALKVKSNKTKAMHVLYKTETTDMLKLCVDGGSIAWVNSFPQLGSLVSADGFISEVAHWISHASVAF